MARTPRVPIDDGDRPLGRLVLVDGSVIEVSLGFRDLVNGGVVFDVADVELVLKDGAEVASADFFGGDVDEEAQVFIPGSRLSQVILSVRQGGSRRAGFFS